VGAARSTLIGVAATVAWLVAAGGNPAGARQLAEAREVRQLVTFRFLPGQLRAIRRRPPSTAWWPHARR
jgi:hypothetical protein